MKIAIDKQAKGWDNVYNLTHENGNYAICFAIVKFLKVFRDILNNILRPVMIGNKLLVLRCREPVCAANRYEPKGSLTHELFD